MRAVVDFAIAAVDFARIETRRVKRGAVGAGIMLAVAIAGAMLVFLGLAAIMASVYMAMTGPLSPPVAALLTGLLTLVVALLVFWIAKKAAL